ncbi:UbiX family flavin prenyltransferase [Alkalihalobacillus trypoxylicola]|uniref:Flavin prenyltransferase UbiX n=1 Tax=Alkalihalobacillus trypoxylicola TaxID=519424 RepID=A0A162D669_9BACI|nr:UbiX family flavin prenyltransferase [Alkalihalobacillus trypoxylicola]KYG28262.1 3-octaprenyl-4-hydroxybenzoate carboxy-lyase [Alkalihalobacillus trypoxylicola]
MTKIVVGISGASGAIYGIRILEVLKSIGVESHAIISKAAEKTISYETSYHLDEVINLADFTYEQKDIGASISSGSFKVDGMIVAPCSIKSLSAIAHSYNDELITRAADVQLKERRKLVLIVRETPFNLSHLQSMTLVTQMGGVILPPVPSFYHKPQTIEDIVNQTVGKALDQFNIDAQLFNRWSGEV